MNDFAEAVWRAASQQTGGPAGIDVSPLGFAFIAAPRGDSDSLPGFGVVLELQFAAAGIEYR
jgi:hypothetical protein